MSGENQKLKSSQSDNKLLIFKDRNTLPSSKSREDFLETLPGRPSNSCVNVKNAKECKTALKKVKFARLTLINFKTYYKVTVCNTCISLKTNEYINGTEYRVQK